MIAVDQCDGLAGRREDRGHHPGDQRRHGVDHIGVGPEAEVPKEPAKMVWKAVEDPITVGNPTRNLGLNLWAMNQYMREGGANNASREAMKHFLWSRSEGEIKRIIKFFGGGFNLLRALSDPKVPLALFRAWKVARHYRKYPHSPQELEKWSLGMKKLLPG